MIWPHVCKGSAVAVVSLLASVLATLPSHAQPSPPKLYLTVQEALAAGGPPPAACLDATGANLCINDAPLQYANVGESDPDHRYQIGRWYHCVSRNQQPVSCKTPGSLVDAPLADIAVIRVAPAPPRH